MMTCEIQWIDKAGVPTPDTNPSIGRVRTLARVYIREDGSGVTLDASRYYRICQHHAGQLILPGMHIWEWEV